MRIGLYKQKHIFLSGYKKDKLKNRFVLLFILFIFMSSIYMFFERIYPNFIRRVEAYANNLAVSTINKTLSETMQEENSSFAKVTTNENGAVTSTQTDTAGVNRFKAVFVDNLQKNVNAFPDGYIKIPLGSLSKKEIFQGFGPRIKIKVVPSGIVKVDFKEDFVSCGINQVKHKIYLDVYLTISLNSATMRKTQTVNTIIPVSETIISGTVPNYYGSGIGITSNNKNIEGKD